MLEKNQRTKSMLSGLLDVVLLFVSFLLANYVRFNYVVFFEPGGAGPALQVAGDPRNFIAGAGTSVLLVLAYWVAGVYSSSRLRGLARRCTIMAMINAAGIMVFVFFLYLMHLDDYSRVVLGLFYGFATVAMVAKRMIRRWVDRARRRKGLGLRHILLVGGGKSAALYLRALEHNPYYGFVVDGYLAATEEPGLGVPYLGGYDKLDEALESAALDEVVVALEANEIDQLPHTFAICDKHGTRITMVPFYSDYLPARPTIDVLDECKLINVRQTPFDNILNAAIKRGLDIIGSLVLIVLTSPVMLVTAIGVKLSSPGPIIFKQERIGLNKKPFMMYKFRSMRVNVQ
ncbi:MAG: sugar transferase, partial [Gemmiger sp.]